MPVSSPGNVVIDVAKSESCIPVVCKSSLFSKVVSEFDFIT